MQRLGELAPDDEARAQRRRVEDAARTAGSRSSPSGGQLGALGVLLAAGADADDLVGRDVAEQLGVLEVRELVLDLDRRLDVLARDR